MFFSGCLSPSALTPMPGTGQPSFRHWKMNCFLSEMLKQVSRQMLNCISFRHGPEATCEASAITDLARSFTMCGSPSEKHHQCVNRLVGYAVAGGVREQLQPMTDSCP